MKELAKQRLSNKVSKIRIVGSVGSGKTTLARNLSQNKGITMYSLDDVMWTRFPEGDRRSSEEELNAKLEGIFDQSTWIIEGTHLGWSMKTFDEADMIIFLNPKLPVRIYRITRRFLLQKKGIEPANYVPSWRMYGRMFKWTYQYETIYKKQVRAIIENSSKRAIEILDGTELGV
jgi:adenylate kinase family enzyme